jgi:RNA polymerase sigma-70 factor (ECF subfamily)
MMAVPPSNGVARPAPPGDGDLVRQTLAGNPSAYEPLVRRWSGRVLAVCHARVGRSDVAEELAQETLYRAFKALSSLAEPEKFGHWICGIAVRVCLDHLKSKRARATVPMSALGEDVTFDDFPDEHEPHAADPELDEELAKLMQEVNRLPAKHREALMLYYYQDCTYDDLARTLGVSAATINARLTQARQMLRQRLSAV